MDTNFQNDYIISYCKDQYINSKMNPQFAVLIKGKWGCGKTFLVKEILRKTYGNPKEIDKNVIWLSVYGLSSIEQISSKLYEKIHPILSSKVFEYAKTVATSAIKIKTGIDLNKDNKEDVSFDISLIDIRNEEEKNSTKKLLIVDDIERCSIPSCELLGFFSEGIIDNSLRVIFVGNTEEMADKSDKRGPDITEKKEVGEKPDEKISEFDSIKEKIIGMEFEVKPDVPNAVKSFVSELHLEKMSDILIEKSFLVLERLQYENLRNVRQAFWQISQVVTLLGNERNDKNYLAEMIEYFLVVFLQKTGGKLLKSDVNDTINTYVSYHTSVEEHKKKSDKDIYYFYEPKVPLGKLYAEIIFDGKFDAKAIQDNYDAFTNKKDPRTPLQMLIQEWFLFSDNDFKELYTKVDEQFKNGTLLNPYEILQYAHLLLELSSDGIIQNTPTAIKDKVCKYITDNSSKIEQEMNLTSDVEMRELKTGKAEYNEIFSALAVINTQKTEEKLKKVFLQYYHNLPVQLPELEKNIYRMAGNRIYDEFPILSYLDINDFFTCITRLNFEQQRSIFYAFNERYGKSYANSSLDKKYYPDIQPVKKLAELYNSKTVVLNMSTESLHRKLLGKWYDELYTWMDEQQKTYP
jgi:hypothetical protein